MNNKPQIFTNEQFGAVRIIIIESEPWFVGKDVAEILGYSNASKAVMAHVDDEDKQFVMMNVADSQNGNLVKTALINESGLYSLILSSKLPSAKEFKRWVTSEVLPSIRKHGAYMTQDTLEKALTSPDFLIQLATQLKEEQEARKALEAEKAVLLPKASYCDVILHSPGLLSVTQIAKDYGESAVWLNKILAEEKVQYKHRKEWILYSKYADKGYATSQTGTHPTSEGIGSHLHTYWTQKGRQFIYELLKNKRGIVPIMERETEETA